MERAGKLLGQSKLAARCLTPEQMALASWPVAVGKKIGAHTRPVSLVRGRLVVETGDSEWRRQLLPLRNQIVDLIRAVLGADIVQEVEFRLATPKRQPERAAAAVRGREPGEIAEQVEDPVLDRIYRLSKQRGQKKAAG